MKLRVLAVVGVGLAFLISGCADKTQQVQPEKAKKERQLKNPQISKKASNEEKANIVGAGVESENAAREGQVAVNEEATSAEDAQQQVADISEVKIYFDFDKFNIRDDMREYIDISSQKIDELPDGTIIKIEGNCDEWGTDEYNYALGLKRAKSVKEALKANGVHGKKMKLISYGESNPVCTEHNKKCWEKNRRVEFKVLQ